MYFEVYSEIRFRKHSSQSSLYSNGAEYLYRRNTCFYVSVLYVLYDSLVSTDLQVSINAAATAATNGVMSKPPAV